MHGRMKKPNSPSTNLRCESRSLMAHVQLHYYKESRMNKVFDSARMSLSIVLLILVFVDKYNAIANVR